MLRWLRRWRERDSLSELGATEAQRPEARRELFGHAHFLAGKRIKDGGIENGLVSGARLQN